MARVRTGVVERLAGRLPVSLRTVMLVVERGNAPGGAGVEEPQLLAIPLSVADTVCSVPGDGESKALDARDGRGRSWRRTAVLALPLASRALTR